MNLNIISPMLRDGMGYEGLNDRKDAEHVHPSAQEVEEAGIELLDQWSRGSLGCR